MEHGIIRDWNDMERIWHYIFSKEQLQTVAEEVFPHVPDTWYACLDSIMCVTCHPAEVTFPPLPQQGWYSI